MRFGGKWKKIRNLKESLFYVALNNNGSSHNERN